MPLTISLRKMIDYRPKLTFRRFLLNLPEEEVASHSRLGFQIEQAYWFYDDFYRVENRKLPKLSLRQFGLEYKSSMCHNNITLFSSTAPKVSPMDPQMGHQPKQSYRRLLSLQITGPHMWNHPPQ